MGQLCSPNPSRNPSMPQGRNTIDLVGGVKGSSAPVIPAGAFLWRSSRSQSCSLHHAWDAKQLKNFLFKAVCKREKGKKIKSNHWEFWGVANIWPLLSFRVET